MTIVIATWNVNGLLTLKQAASRSPSKTLLDSISESVEAPLSKNSQATTQTCVILCLQEVKCSRRKILDEGLANPPNHHAFHAISRTKQGYAGVSTFIPKTLNCIYAQDGFFPSSPATKTSNLHILLDSIKHRDFRLAIAGLFDKSGGEENAFSVKEIKAMDDEGRVLFVDLGWVVLVNAYFPRATIEEVDRYNFKSRFQKAIRKVLYNLTHPSPAASDYTKRSVILLGDLNIAHKPLDHSDPTNATAISRFDAFGDSPARIWMDSIVGSLSSINGGETSGPFLVDVYRNLHPTTPSAYTCWNTLTNARAANFGTRIDYILASPDLIDGPVGRIRQCVVAQNIDGSDHCPVVVEIFVDVADNEEGIEPVVGSSALWEEVVGGGKQTRLTEWMRGDTSEKRRRVIVGYDNGENSGEHGQKNVAAVETTSSTCERSDSRQVSRPTSTCTLKQQKLQRQSKQQRSIASFFKKPEFESHLLTGISSNTVSPLIFSAKTDSLAEHETCPNSGTSAGGVEKSQGQGIIANIAREADTKAVWQELLKRPANPKCYHEEEAKEFRVNKSGPNQGRVFYLCARPIGPSDAPAKGTGRNQRKISEFRCDYFKWKK